jgi:hypothetical protein
MESWHDRHLSATGAGTASNLELELAERRRQAREERVRLNRMQSCEECAGRDGPAEALPGEAA